MAVNAASYFTARMRNNLFHIHPHFKCSWQDAVTKLLLLAVLGLRYAKIPDAIVVDILLDLMLQRRKSMLKMCPFTFMYFACQGCLSCTILQRCLTNGILGQPLNNPSVHVQVMNNMEFCIWCRALMFFDGFCVHDIRRAVPIFTADSSAPAAHLLQTRFWKAWMQPVLEA